MESVTIASNRGVEKRIIFCNQKTNHTKRKISFYLREQLNLI